MSNIKLKNHTWDAGNVYDANLNKTQAEINAMTGRDGADGVSPEVTFSTIPGGHTITITDAEHPNGQSFNVMDGVDGDPAPSEDVADAVTTWLSENISQETGYVIDATLTTEGAAADAKATGDGIGRIDVLEDTLFVEVPMLILYEQGTLNSSTGATTTGNQNYRIRSPFLATEHGIKVVVPDELQMYWYKYSTPATSGFEGNSGGWLQAGTYILNEASYYKIVLAYTGTNERIYPEDGLNVTITRFEATDKTLTAYGRAADAQVVGDILTDVKSKISVANSSLNGHVVAYGTTDAEMQIYKEINNEPVVYGSIPASDFIPCRSDYLYNLFVENSSATSNTKYYVYIYDSNKQIAFDVLKHVNSDTNEINCFTAAEWAQINGFQFKEIPTGYYIRYSLSPYDKVPRLYVWDGVKCGLPLTARSGDFGSDESGQFVSGNAFDPTPSTGRSIMPVPPGVSMLIAKPGYTFVGMRSLIVPNTFRSSINESYVFPSQILSLTGYKCSDSQFKALVSEKFKDVILAKEYNYADGTYNKTVVDFDLSNYVCAIPSFKDTGIQTVEKGFGRSTQIKKVVDAINNFTWTCKSTVKVKVEKEDGDDELDAGEYFTLHEGVTYRGVPYRSDWTRATFFGWHITANTFANAANDPNSVLYTFEKGVVDNETILKKGIYYSLVCSSYGSLISLFPYPGTNFSLVRDPNYDVSITTDPDIGTLISNGIGHCLVPIYKSQNSGSKQSAIAIVESSGIFTNLSNYYREFFTSRKRKDNDVAHGAYGTFELRHYMYGIKYPSDLTDVTPYDIDKVIIKNGSARPHKGDGSVYTGYNDVVINIHDPNANRLYYQKVTGTFDHGILDGSLSTDGNASYISFEPGSTSVMLQPEITAESSSSILQNGGIYAVWASNGDAQTTMPDNAEIFEWYDKSGTVRYSVQNGVLYTDDEFWYARGSGYDAKKRIRDKDTGMITIPYEAPSSEGGHSDYSKYADSYSVKDDRDVFFFKKGVLGAYQIFGTKVS